MAGAMFAALDAELRITTAGTHVIEGQPMSWRTRDAMKALGYEAPGHRSRQLSDVHVEDADLVVALAVEHVRYVRRTHPEAAARTATLRRLVRDLAPGESPLAERVAALDLASVQLEDWEDVTDPAGGDVDDFHACAKEVESLIIQLSRLI
jgi:protein-tyrosine phosphatase